MLGQDGVYKHADSPASVNAGAAGVQAACGPGGGEKSEVWSQLHRTGTGVRVHAWQQATGTGLCRQGQVVALI